MKDFLRAMKGAARTAAAWARPALFWTTTVLAGLFVFFALVAPTRSGNYTPAAFVRLPVEALIGVAIIPALPRRARLVGAILAGVGLGLLTILRVLDIGFYEILDRPFDPVLDWSLLRPAMEAFGRSMGGGTLFPTVVAVVAAVAVLVLMTLSVLRLTRLVGRHPTGAVRTVAVLGVVWVVCAALGVQLAGAPVAAKKAAGTTYYRLRQVHASMQDKREFAKLAGVDAFRDTPGTELLTALRGKDVIVAFVESYGRSALEDKRYASQVGALLDAGNRRLAAAGFAARSAFLTSSTAGGNSWLAHATVQSGLWINNEQRYRTLLASDRLTLGGAFKRAGWRTVGVEPAITRAWPEGEEFYGFDKLYTAKNLGYEGPQFTFGSIPDQYTLSAFHRMERAAPGGAPVMAQIVLVSSHMPWTPLPRLIDWDDVGDGSAFAGMEKAGDSVKDVLRDKGRMRDAYRRSVEYSVDSLVSYVEHHGDDDLVLILLGDHQPGPSIVGERASRDVPISVVARDPAVLDRISAWGWQPGLKPAPQAPVWKMDAFRDRFLTAFGTHS